MQALAKTGPKPPIYTKPSEYRNYRVWVIYSHPPTVASCDSGAKPEKASTSAFRSYRRQTVDAAPAPHAHRSYRRQTVDAAPAPHSQRSYRRQTVDAAPAPHSQRSYGRGRLRQLPTLWRA